MDLYENIDYYENKNYQSLAVKAYDILEEAIVMLYLKPGQTYSETDLSSFTGIGRTPVREAVKRLESTYLLEISPRKGITITKVRLEECYLQMEVRNMLERLIAIRAAKFSTPQERKIFLDLADRYQAATDRMDALASMRIDYEFNDFESDCARNIFAKTALLQLHPLARRLYYMQFHVSESLTRDINNAHCELMKAIASGDENKTIHASEHLLKQIQKLTVSTMDTIFGEFNQLM